MKNILILVLLLVCAALIGRQVTLERGLHDICDIVRR